MAPSTTGWIDIHGHFYLPATEQDRIDRWKACHAADFMVPEPWDWKPEDVLAYLDKAGIAMQMISYIPKKLDILQQANDYGASVVKKHPSRFGLMAALPSDDPKACLEEIDRTVRDLSPDGFAVTCQYNGVYLSDRRLDDVWRKLDEMNAVVFMHPDAYKESHMGRPAPVIEVAFETTRTLVDMLYQGVFRRYPNIKWIAAHGGGAVPVLSDRLELLGTEPWVPNPEKITKEEVKKYLSTLYLDTAAVGVSSLIASLRLVGKERVVYGADCGVPCSTAKTMEENKACLLAYEGLSEEDRSRIGTNLHRLFPNALKRMGR